MFDRKARGLLDFVVAALCLWGAAYHTPVGQGLRAVAGRVFGFKVSDRPLLAYYSGGVYGTREVIAPSSLPALAVELPPQAALAYGVYATWRQLPESFRKKRAPAALRYGINLSRLEDATHGPTEALRWLALASQSLHSEEAAVVAIFAGHEPARYAHDRVQAQGASATLEELVRQLPPGFDEHIGYASQAMSLGTAYGLGWPVPLSAPVTSPFGSRMHPVLGVRRMHTGVDLAVAEGTKVTAVAAGVVRRASEDRVNGQVLVLDHGRGVTTAYCHNSRLLVTVGQKVERGQVIAHSGNTGRSTGPHLHYQLELGSKPTDPLVFRRLATPVVPEPVPAKVVPPGARKAPPTPVPALKAAFGKVAEDKAEATEY